MISKNAVWGWLTHFRWMATLPERHFLRTKLIIGRGNAVFLYRQMTEDRRLFESCRGKLSLSHQTLVGTLQKMLKEPEV